VSAPVLDAREQANIVKAAQMMRQGAIVAFPTETVYGLGADALNEKAVVKVFEAKKRPTFDPLIVHVASVEDAEKLWTHTPPVAKALMKAFWPGPLTLVLPKSAKVPDIVTSGLPTVAVRMPKNDIALALIRALGSPIAAPSANVFGYTSPTSAEHVREDVGDKVDLVLDGGPASVGVESTVLKLEEDGAVLLRPGAVTPDEIKKYVKIKAVETAPGRIEAPGQLESHYAPWTAFYLLTAPYSECTEDVQKLLREAQQKKGTARAGLIAFKKAPSPSPFETTLVLSEKGDLREAAAKLFQAIRKLDKMHLDILLAEPVPPQGIGLAIMDRLKKASGGKTLC
jgi:L-threonylcarbamoyladenylate synthase